MITSIQTINYAGGGARVIWQSDLASPVFRVFVNGELVKTTTVNFIDLAGTETSAQVDVFDQDEPNALPNYTASGIIKIRWERSTTAQRYRVERLISAEWVEQALIPETGKRMYQQILSNLPDDTTQQVRVVAIDETGSEWVMETLTFLVVRPPEPVDFAISYGNAGEIILTEVSA